jgi:spore germination protein YaaH
MKKAIYFFIFFLGCVNLSFSQEHMSIHQLSKIEHQNDIVSKSLFNKDGEGIIPLKFDKSQLTAAVFGYLPDWNYSSARSYLRYDLLTHIAAFEFDASASGGISEPSYWPWTDVINKAHTNGVKIIMTVVDFTASDIHKIITDTTVKKTFFNNIKTKIDKYLLDGVNIDFESESSSDRAAIVTFMNDLTNFVHTNISADKEVSYAGPAVNWGKWDLPGLVTACDYVFIMGYDYYGSWSTETGPSAPLTNTYYSIQNAVVNSSYGYGGALAKNANKLILGVPYYGQRWKTKTDVAGATVTSYVGSTTFTNDQPNSITYGVKWSTYKTPWYSYKQDSVTYVQTWFDNDSSLGLKYDLAKTYKLKGVGMWALGYDGARTELWNLLQNRYLVTDVAEDKRQTPTGYQLSQNYPNPFNPSTVINYELPLSCKASIKVYDVLGKEIATLVDEEKAAGKYSVEFSSKLSSGIYFYTLRAGTYTSTKKMIYLK